MPINPAPIEKLNTLPVERLAEVEDFEDFISRRAGLRFRLGEPRGRRLRCDPGPRPVGHGSPLSPGPELRRHRPRAVSLHQPGRPTQALGEILVRHWLAAGLLKPSAVKPVFTTHQRGLVIRSIGDLAPAYWDALHLKLGRIIG